MTCPVLDQIPDDVILAVGDIRAAHPLADTMDVATGCSTLLRRPVSEAWVYAVLAGLREAAREELIEWAPA